MKNDQTQLTMLYEAVSKQQGFVVVNGLRQSGVEKSLAHVQNHVTGQSSHKQFSILKENSLWSQMMAVPSATLASLQNDAKLRTQLFESDIVYFENTSSYNEFELALRLCEEGRVVVAHFMTPSILTCLHKIFEFVDQESTREHFVWRFAESLLLLYGQQTVTAKESENLIAQEFYLATPDLKKLLQLLNLKKCEEHMKSPTENSGSMTLNQSLIQMILRRKIDLKKAFEVSRDPSDLDLLLKKVGL